MTYQNDTKGLLVKIDTTRFKFPERCPICGDRSVDHGLIARSLPNKRFSTKQYYIRGEQRSKIGHARTTDIKRLQIPVCEKHFFSIDEMSRVRAILTLTSGISISLALFVGTAIGFLLYDELSIPLHLQVFLLVSLSVMAFSMYGLGPSKLDRAVKIIDFDNSDQTIVLQIKNKWYIDELLHMNISSAQIVRYTLKPRF